MSRVLLLLLLLLSAIWGASFLFIKVGVSEMGPLTFSALRVLIGTVGLLPVVLLRRETLPRGWRTWRQYGVMGLFNALIPFGAIAWGTQHIPSGLSAILNATMPLFTVLLSTLWGGETLTRQRILGVLLGFGGVVVLTLPQMGSGLATSIVGQLAVVLGSLSYAFAAVYARRRLAGHSPLVASLGQVVMGSLLLAPCALLVELPALRLPSLRVVLALLSLGVLGTSLAYVIYYRLIQGLGAVGASLVTYIVPLFGVFWGWVILRERLGWHAFLALSMILGGVLLVNRVATLSPGRYNRSGIQQG